VLLTHKLAHWFHFITNKKVLVHNDMHFESLREKLDPADFFFNVALNEEKQKAGSSH
jgi:hypothetical protein